MYVVAIGWMYVVTLMAFAEPTVVAGVLTFVFYGLAPVSLLFWLTGALGRRSRRRHAGPATAGPAADQEVELPATPGENRITRPSSSSKE